MVTKSIRCSGAKIVEFWVHSQASPHTQAFYRRDSARLVGHVRKSLARVTLGDLHSFARSVVAEGLAPISRARTIAATESLFGFCQRMRFSPLTPQQNWLYLVTRTDFRSVSSARRTLTKCLRWRSGTAITGFYTLFMPPGFGCPKRASSLAQPAAERRRRARSGFPSRGGRPRSPPRAPTCMRGRATPVRASSSHQEIP
jgi:hypothetical protein